MFISIAIDGPAGSGKSSLAKEFAKRHNEFLYINTGAMFRAFALHFIKNNIDIENEQQMIDDIQKFSIKLDEDNIYIIENNQSTNVSNEVKEPYVANLASKIAQFEFIRAKLLIEQRNIAKNNNVIMDGRDIGTVVLPNANIKIFLNASSLERAIRRKKELEILNPENIYDLNQIKKDIENRDFQDMNRKIAPLKKANDAIEVNTDGLTVKTCCDLIDEIYNNYLIK